MLHMMFKLGMCAQENWRRLRGFEWLAKVIEGVKFRDGNEVNQSIDAKQQPGRCLRIKIEHQN
jgi:hypothetical protein